MSDVTRVLKSIEEGDSNAAEELLPLVYDELRRLAAAQLANEKPGQTLQATALVHEAYVRLVGSADRQRWDNRRHFVAAAALAMRRILVDNSRKKASLKRGGPLQRRPLIDVPAAASAHEELVDLDAALTTLAQTDAVVAEIVNLRYFAGFSIAEVARLLSTLR